MSARERSDLSAVTVQRYQEVIDGVVGRVRSEFNQEGVDESILDEVRALWEAKLVSTGVVGEASDEGQQVIQQQQQQQQQAVLPPGGAPAAAAPPGTLPVLTAHQQQFLAMMQQRQQQMQQQMMAAGVAPGGAPNVAAFHAMLQAQAQAQAQVAAQHAAADAQKRRLEGGAEGPDAKVHRPTIPQQDGPADDAGGDEGGDGEGDGGGGEGSGAATAEDDDDPLTDDDENSGDEVDEAAVANVVLGQFEKVQRSKAKWKIVLKDLVATLNGRDYLIRRCTGDMHFL